jgi:riboflavin kinase/FMN adenylyltransferase
VVAVGNFDGVHLGHRALVETARREAAARAAACVALTFDPHPARVLAADRAPRALMTARQKAEWLERLGVDVWAVLPFTAHVASQAPGTFVEVVLGGALAARAVVVGEDFRFGAGRAGDVPALRALGERLGFAVVALPAVRQGGAPVSSTRIREALQAGEVEDAADLLGRPYEVDGVVVPGDARGRTLGFPTANIAVENEIVPKEGVYAVVVEGAEAPGGTAGVANLGRRPTFGGGAPILEVHLLDFRGELYGRSLRVSFQTRLRDEVRFEGVNALKAQITKDIQDARATLGRGRPGV